MNLRVSNDLADLVSRTYLDSPLSPLLCYALPRPPAATTGASIHMQIRSSKDGWMQSGSE